MPVVAFLTHVDRQAKEKAAMARERARAGLDDAKAHARLALDAANAHAEGLDIQSVLNRVKDMKDKALTPTHR